MEIYIVLYIGHVVAAFSGEEDAEDYRKQISTAWCQAEVERVWLDSVFADSIQEWKKWYHVAFSSDGSSVEVEEIDGRPEWMKPNPMRYQLGSKAGYIVDVEAPDRETAITIARYRIEKAEKQN